MRDGPRRPSDLHGTQSVLVYDIETISAAEPADGGFPPWPTHETVAAAFLHAQLGPDGRWEFDLQTLVQRGEQDVRFLSDIEEQMTRGATKITYNGRGFDAPVLRLNAMTGRRFDCPSLAEHAGANRFGAEHADLAELFAGYGATRKVSMAELCKPLGIPVKTSTTGADVGQLWRESRIDEIASYVREDVVATYLLWLHWSAFRASEEALITRPMAALMRHLERDPELAHLRPFVDSDLARWARSRAMRADVTAAIGRADRKLGREQDERAFAGVAPTSPLF